MEESLKRWLLDPTVDKAAAALVGITVVVLIGRLLQRAAFRYLKEASTQYRARKVISFATYVAALVLLTIVFSDRLGGVTVAFGVAGAGIAFALQEVIVSIAGWAAISFGGFYKTCDRVQLGGIQGDVIDIGVLRTTLMETGQWVHGDLYNGRIVRVSNSFVFKEPVFNYSADFPFLWDEIKVPIRYGSDWKLAKEMLVRVADDVCKDFALESQKAWLDAVRKYRLEPARVEPMVTLIANDNWLEFTVRYIVDYRRRRTVKDALFTRVLEEVDGSENRIRLASATFELVNLPRLDVAYGDGRARVASTYEP